MYDVTGVEGSQDFDTPIPKGVYRMKIEEIEETTSGSDGRPMLKITFVVTGNKEFNGRKVWDYIKHQDESQAWKMRNFIDALELKEKGGFDPKKIAGTVLVAKIKHEGSPDDEYGISAKIGSLAPLPKGDEAEEEEAEETEEEVEAEGEEGEDEELTAADVRETEDMDDLREIISDYGVEGIRITKKSTVESVQQKIIDKLELEEEEIEIPEDWDALTALDRDEAVELIEAAELTEEIDPDEYEDDRELLEAIAEELEIEVPEEEEDAPPDYTKMTIAELKAECVERGLRDKGSKKALVGRLKKDDKESAKGDGGSDGDPF